MTDDLYYDAPLRVGDKIKQSLELIQVACRFGIRQIPFIQLGKDERGTLSVTVDSIIYMIET